MKSLEQALHNIAHNKRKLDLWILGLGLGFLAALAAPRLPVVGALLSAMDLSDAPGKAAWALAPLWLLAVTQRLQRHRGVGVLSMPVEDLIRRYPRHGHALLRLGRHVLPSVEVVRWRGQDIRDFRVVVAEGNFQLPWTIQQHSAALVRGFTPASHFNGATLRFEGLDPQDPARLRLRHATYFDHLVTNGAHDQTLFNELTVRDVLEPGPMLTPLEAARCANHLGLSVLVLSSDHHLMLQLRSAGVSAFPGMLAPSVSGVGGCDTLTGDDGTLALAHWFVNEMREEISPELSLEDFTAVRALGLSRELIRLGKPEMFFLARSRLPRQRLDTLRRQALAATRRIDDQGRRGGTAANTPDDISHNESSRLVWLDLAGQELAQALAGHALRPAPTRGTGAALCLTVERVDYLVSEPLAANLAFACAAQAAPSGSA